MNIIIIHDRDVVASELERIAKEEIGIRCNVDVAEDVLTARDFLKVQHYDLAVVDLTLPIKIGKGEATLENAQFILDDIFGDGDAKAPADVLGISKEPEILTLVKTTIGQHLMACLFEDANGQWKERFAEKLKYLSGVKRSRRVVANSTYDVDLLIITALDKEGVPFADLFELDDCDEFPRAKEFNFTDRNLEFRRGVLFSVGAAGQAATASATQALLCQFRPRLALMSGFCGGVADRVNQGDIVAFTSSEAWDNGKWIEDKSTTAPVFQARPATLNIEERGVRLAIRDIKAAGYKPSKADQDQTSSLSKGKIRNWKLEPGAAGSGSAVVTSPSILDRIKGRNEDIRAIDMESYAFYHACRNTPVLRPDFLCVKSVADFCNGQKSSELHSACSWIAASFTKLIATKYFGFD